MPRVYVNPIFTSMWNKISEENLKEVLILILNAKLCGFIVVLQSIINFPPSINHFLNSLVVVNLEMKIDFEIFVRSHFLQVVVFIHEISISDVIGFNYHNI